MISINETTYSKDLANRKITVVREFDAPVELVWRAWTEKELLDQWWAPKPYQAKTKSMDFREGGIWLYNMEGPEGDAAFCRVDFEQIREHKFISSKDMFCDERGNPNDDFPKMRWTNHFTPTESGTKVQVVVSFNSEADLEKIVEMGFQEGFAAAHGNLDELLEKQLQ